MGQVEDAGTARVPDDPKRARTQVRHKTTQRGVARETGKKGEARIVTFPKPFTGSLVVFGAGLRLFQV